MLWRSRYPQVLLVTLSKSLAKLDSFPESSAVYRLIEQSRKSPHPWGRPFLSTMSLRMYLGKGNGGDIEATSTAWPDTLVLRKSPINPILADNRRSASTLKDWENPNQFMVLTSVNYKNFKNSHHSHIVISCMLRSALI